MITVKNIPNIFRGQGRTSCEVKFVGMKTVEEYIKLAGYDVEDKRAVMMGKCVELTELVPNNSEILVVPNVRWFFGALFAGMSFFAIISIGMMIYSIISYLTYKKPTMPNFGTSGINGDEASPTYGWEGVKTTQEVGLPVPVVYGEHKVGGNIINAFVSTDGDKEYLNLLIGLCEGEIEDIGSIKINDNLLENFTGVEDEIRLGTVDQSQIANFADIHNNVNLNVTLLKDAAYVHTTVINDCEGFDIQFDFPLGLYSQSESSAGINSWAVSYRIEYKLHSSGDYILLDNYTISAKSRTAIKRIMGMRGLAAGTYDIRITKTSDNSTFYNVGDLQITNIDEILPDDLVYPFTALLSLKLLATNQLSGATPQISCVVKGRKIRMPLVLESDDSGAAEALWENYYYDPIAEVFKYLSNDQVLYWDGVTYVNRYSANPVWCLRDLLISKRYGLGEDMDSSLLNDAMFLEMALYCEEKVPNGYGAYEKRYRMDMVLDASTRAPDILAQAASVFDAFSFYSAGMYQFKIDKPEASRSMLFGMGNIIEKSFNFTQKSLREVFNVIEAQYENKDLDYAIDSVIYEDIDSIEAGNPIRKKQIKVYTTQKSYAVRAARRALLQSKYINGGGQFKAAIDAVLCQPGDRIGLSHDVPQWGYSGRIKSGSTTSVIKLDREVTVEEAITYKILVKYADDTYEEKAVANAPGTADEITVSTPLSKAPAEFDIYVFGLSTAIVKDYRLLGGQKEDNGEVTLVIVEYNPLSYDDTNITIPTDNASLLTQSIPPVLGLALTEGIVLLADSTIESSIEVWFARPDTTQYRFKRYSKARIYLSDDDGASYSVRGETSTNHFIIQGGLEVGKTYLVKVVSMDAIEEALFSTSPEEEIVLAGRSIPPATAGSFAVDFTGKNAEFSWATNVELDFVEYEIRKEDANWGVINANFVWRGNALRLSLPVVSATPGAYYIKAINTSRKYSTVAATVTPTNAAPSVLDMVSATPFYMGVEFAWPYTSIADLKDYQVRTRVSDPDGGNPDDWSSWASTMGSRHTRILTIAETVEHTYGAKIEIEVKVRDYFDQESAAVGAYNYSLIVADTLTPPTMSIPYYKTEPVFTNNSPTAGSVAWSSCTLVWKGVEYEITADNTALNYIYFDTNYPTVFKASNTQLDAVGAGKILVCINSTGTAYSFLGTQIPGQAIQPLTILAAAIAAGTITADKFSVANLAAIVADLGAITSGSITLSLGGVYRLKISTSGIQGSNDSGANWYNIITQSGSSLIIGSDSIVQTTLVGILAETYTPVLSVDTLISGGGTSDYGAGYKYSSWTTLYAGKLLTVDSKIDIYPIAQFVKSPTGINTYGFIEVRVKKDGNVVSTFTVGAMAYAASGVGTSNQVGYNGSYEVTSVGIYSLEYRFGWTNGGGEQTFSFTNNPISYNYFRYDPVGLVKA
jgi:predicted phage tail protein